MTVLESNTPTVTAGWTAALVRAAAARGLERADLLRGIRLPEDVFDDPDARVSSAADLAIWNRVTRLVGDDGIGLDVATRQLRSDSLGVVGLAAMTSETVDCAYATTARHHRLVCEDAALEYRVGAVADFSHKQIGPGLDRPAAHAEATLGTALVLARAWSGVEVRPLQVRFEHARPHHAGRLAALFGVEPHYNQRDTTLVLSRESVALPLRTCNPAVRAYLMRRAAAEDTGGGDPIIDDLREAIADVVASASQPALPALAARLGTTARTLQRRLSTHGLAYRDLVADVRMRSAARMLTDRRVSISNVAARLGYTNAAAFRRAFQRWSGITPVRYRQRSH